jgi:hypothetical protein
MNSQSKYKSWLKFLKDDLINELFNAPYPLTSAFYHGFIRNVEVTLTRCHYNIIK